MNTKFKIPVSMLKKQCNLSNIKFETTEDIPKSDEIIGQKRAVKALNFGLSVKHKGYNIYVSGIIGTGKNSYSYSVAKEYASKLNPPDDWCYVYNFIKTVNPKAIRLKAGQGIVFKRDIDDLIKKLKIEIPKYFASDEYNRKKNIIYSSFHEKTEKVIEELNDIADKYNFRFKQSDKGLISYPIIDNRPMKEEELENLTEDEIQEFKNNSVKLSTEASDIIKRLHSLETQLKNRMNQLKDKVTFDVVDMHISPVVEKFNCNESIKKYLNQMEDDIIKNINMFLENNKKEDQIENLLNKGKSNKSFFKRYEVNLFIDNSNKEGAPVIKENNPNYYNLLGKIEYFNELSVLKTDHTRIKPGAIHEANGGFLIIQAKDILTSPYAWEGLKRALNSNEIKIENITKTSVVAETIKPMPIPIELKIIMIGDYYTYQLLYNYDDDFKKLFRIRADFDIEMDRSDINIKKIASFVANHCKQENLKSFHKSAINKIIEYSSRLAEHQEKLTCRFNEIVEILYEADALANLQGDNIVTEDHIIKAIDEKIYRNNKYEEKLNELIKSDVLLIQTSGWEIGQINGLAVIDSGQYSFGRPNKITVSTYAGKEGIINIEREVEQSGNTHDKGVLILGGYLGEKYAQSKPLSLSANITFEQSYDFIDGDSASSTELYALLSSLSGLPINQAIAVTGSVNQKGLIQPIGGVNEKIEGYYKVCKAKGFKEGQGVIIPHQNIKNLMLSDEVINACKDDKFTVYAVKSIDEGIQILTGVAVGEVDKKGNYKPGTVNHLVQKKLNYYANINKEYE